MPTEFAATQAVFSRNARGFRECCTSLRWITCAACIAAAFIGVAAFISAGQGLANDDDQVKPSSTSVASTSEKVRLYAEQWSTAEQMRAHGGIVLPDDGRLDTPVERIDLAHRRLTTADLQLLDKFKALTGLSLAYTEATDGTLQVLPPLGKLTSLDLSFNPALTARSLKGVERFSALKTLHVEGTAIRENDLDTLRRRRPDLEITSGKSTLLPRPSNADATARLRALAGEGKLLLFCANEQIEGLVGRLDDDQLRWLSAEPQLERAFLNGSLIHGRGLQYLAGNEKLWRLELFHCPLSEDELEPLGELTQLLALNVWGTNFGDRGMLYAGNLIRLQNLFLDDTRVTDEGLKQLVHLPRLVMLTLRGDRITDIGVERISALSHLKLLDLRETQATDACIPTLAGLTTLAQLDVTRSRITPAGLEKLKAALPRARVLGWTAGDDASEARLAVRADGRSVDLLSGLDPKAPPDREGAVRGRWVKTREGLLSPTTAPAWFETDEPPAEYDLAITLERVLGTDSVDITVPVNGGAVTACIDADQGTGNWIEGVGGQHYWGGEGTHWQPHLLTAGKPHELLLQIRRTALRLYCDEKPIIHWVGDARRLAPFANWPIPNHKAIYLGSWNTVFRFTKVDLRPVNATANDDK
jgi:hypothetical protein